jgi:predicted secreted hydrolase
MAHQLPAATRVRRASPVALLLALAWGLVLPDAPSADEGWQRAEPGFDWQFPRDHWAHEGYRSEWWYLTGHLTSAEGRRFGYQFTFFRVGLLPEVPEIDSPWAARDLVMGHAALTDLDTGEHRFSDLLYRAMPLLGGFPPFNAESPDLDDPALLAWSRAPVGTPGRWTLHFNGSAFDVAMRDDREGFALDLRTTAAKPRIFQGPGGFSAKTDDAEPAASLYYSFTRLHAAGTLVVAGDTLTVTGDSWMDKEFGSDKLAARQTGWDWFSLQLADGRELMLYLLRHREGGVDFARGTLVEVDGTARWLRADEFDVEVLDRWRSDETGADYPAAWRVRVGDESWRVRPLVNGQENVGRSVPDLFYWEGAVEVLAGGDRAGRGYVELTGYGASRRPGL